MIIDDKYNLVVYRALGLLLSCCEGDEAKDMPFYQRDLNILKHLIEVVKSQEVPGLSPYEKDENKNKLNTI